MRATKVVALLAALALYGCVSDEQRSLQLSAQDDSQCQSYGAKPGSQAYFTCRLQKDQSRQARRAQMQAAILGHPTTPATTNVYVSPYPGYVAPPSYLNTASNGGRTIFDSMTREMQLKAASQAE